MTVGLKRDRLLRDDRGEAIASAARTLQLETEGLSALEAALPTDLVDSFAEAIDMLRACRGRVIVTGMGKSGHVGLKVAATLSSTGTPAYFVHPSEASHGDLGMITARRRDPRLLLVGRDRRARQYRLLFAALRRAADRRDLEPRDRRSAKAAELVLALPQSQGGLSRTGSRRPPRRVMQLALGDCLAIALLESKGFTARDFKALHPGGQLGARLKFVGDLMHKGDRLPLAAADVRHGRGHRGHDREGSRLPRRRRRQTGCSPASSPTATCAVTWATACSPGVPQDIMTRGAQDRLARPSRQRRARNDQRLQDHRAVRGRERHARSASSTSTTCCARRRRLAAADARA